MGATQEFRYSLLNDRKMTALSAEYYSKVPYDFTRILYLGLRSETRNLRNVISEILVKFNEEYEAHREVEYRTRDGARISHLYIRFRDGECAEQARDYFQQDPQLAAQIVHNVLTTWYILERTSGVSPWTFALMDIVGAASYTHPLSPDTAHGILTQFGDSLISSCQSGIGEFDQHVQVLFSSMAEALGASIAHGLWYHGYQRKSPRFHYRIRIIVSDKEIRLFNKFVSKTNGLDAFHLEFFLYKDGNYVENFQNEGISQEVPQNEAPRNKTPRFQQPPRQFNRNGPYSRCRSRR